MSCTISIRTNNCKIIVTIIWTTSSLSQRKEKMLFTFESSIIIITFIKNFRRFRTSLCIQHNYLKMISNDHLIQRIKFIPPIPLLIDSHNIIVIFDNRTMSRQNSIEKRLLDNVTTLKKMLVDCDINSWNQTNRKQLAQQKNKIFFRPKMKQKYTKIIPLEKLETIDDLQRDKSVQRLVFQKKEHIKTNSTHCSNRIRNVSLLDNQIIDSNQQIQAIPSPNIITKPFNTGYVLKELRKKVKQRNYLKKFNPTTSNDRVTRSSCLQQLDTSNSIRYFKSQFKKLEVMSSRSTKTHHHI